jgi:hypothetical protein
MSARILLTWCRPDSQFGAFAHRCEIDRDHTNVAMYWPLRADGASVFRPVHALALAIAPGRALR